MAIGAIRVCQCTAAYLRYYWGEPERAPPRALQRLRSLSHNNDDNGNGGISYVLPNAHARSLRGKFKGQSRQSESHWGNARGIVELLNRPNIGRCVQWDEELRIEHGML